MSTPRRRTPFVDPALVRGQLYATAERLVRRTTALHRAKVSGRHTAQVIADLAMQARPALTVVDIGCGRGTTTGVLADRLSPAELIALDISPAMLAAARARIAARCLVRFLCADFHYLPLRNASCHLMVAAFCLYHSSRPTAVIAELARCLAVGGTAILVTKSANSYRALDELVATAGLDPQATARPSLYAAAHSANLHGLAASALDVRQVFHEEHRFQFTGLAHAAEYLATSPKYALPDQLRDNPAALAAALQAELPDRPVTTTSTVTYIVATRPPELTHRKARRLS